MKLRSTLTLLLGTCLLGTLSAQTDAANPPNLYPSALGFSFSEQTGIGFNYRLLNSQGGWQVAGMATTNNFFSSESLYSLGVAKHFVLFSFVANEWFFSQFYWLGSAAWRTESYLERSSKANPNPQYEWDTITYYNIRQWKEILVAGPALGIEVGLLKHFSFNLEVGYKVGYDFNQPSKAKAFFAIPGVSGIFLYRF